MRLRVAVVAVALAAVLAGCAGRPSDNGASAAAAPTTTTPVSSTPAAGGDAAFVLAGPILKFANGTWTKSFHEDDVAFAHYELSLTPGSRRDATAFVSLLVNQKVIEVQTVHLQPGETRKFDPALSLVNQTRILVEVKVGAAYGSANASVLKWPRIHETLALGNATTTLNAWTNDSAGVHAGLSIWTPEDGRVGAVTLALLCLDAKGKPAAQGEQTAALVPGTAADVSADFPPCATGAPYGIQVKVTEGDADLAGRILLGR